MALIDTSFFVGDLALPNLDVAEVLSDVSQAIDQYEKELLIKLLGYPLYKSFMAADIPTTRWTELTTGKEFSFYLDNNLVSTKWEGLAPTSKKDSIIAYYVYYKIMERNLSTVPGLGGVVVATMENSERVSAGRKMMDAWNKLLKLYGCVQYGYSVYNHFSKYSRDSYSYENDEPSAYNFLLTFPESYPNWVFTPLDEYMNSMGI